MAKNNIINVFLFGEEIGRIGFNEAENRSSFQYNPEFLKKPNFKNIFPQTGIIKRISPVQVFSQFNNETFKGLPPQIADSLPDMFGNLIFKTWLESNDKVQNELTVIEQLAYVSNRGMGALEFFPAKELAQTATINLDEIIEVLKSVLDVKKTIYEKQFDSEALLNIFKIGTSAGGARPKILVSENKTTGEIIPGDVEYSDKYDHYLIKLSVDNELGYPREVVEYCYYLTATAAGISMMNSKLIDEKHFATLRFDRQSGEKQHVLTASGITGWDFKKSENSSYEQLFRLSSFLKISHAQIEQLYKRMIFNIVFRNTDDHLKNHSFIYNKNKDNWRLSPAYDLTFALNPLLDFKRSNQALSVNNKRSGINLKDVLSLAELFTVKNPKGIILEVQKSVDLLELNMEQHGVPVKVKESILKKVQLLI